MKRRAIRKAQRHYAILGYLAEHGPCTADEIAKELGLELGGLVVDLSVEKTVWRRVAAEWEKPSCVELFYDRKVAGWVPRPRRRLYRLATADERKAKR